MPPIGGWKTGVYLIRNKLDGKVYVGGAYKGFEHRWKIHIRDLRSGRHGNNHLLSAWRKYGEHFFEFVIQERVRPDLCECREQYWITELNSTDRRYGYNKSPTAGSPLGYKHTEAYCKAISERNLRMSEETKRKIGAASKGRRKSPESIEKTAAALRGRTRPPEVVEKIAKALRGKKRSPQALANITAANRARVNTDELRRKLGDANRGRKHSPEEIAKRAEGIRKAWARRKEQQRVAKGQVIESD